eukprot:gb/GFBE01052321.1/.p1 GENE.gb/GFBE01052321.1/~~gb/GFBE01052321.1/.p1  ORF type:complete len:473 (+),score=69.81 gb/GFBE01052321.1/:1-1419(+)
MQKAQTPVRTPLKKASPATPVSSSVPKRSAKPAAAAARGPASNGLASPPRRRPASQASGGGSRPSSRRPRPGSSGAGSAARLTDRRSQSPQARASPRSAADAASTVDEALSASAAPAPVTGEESASEKPVASEANEVAERPKKPEPPPALIADIGGTQLGDGQNAAAAQPETSAAAAADEPSPPTAKEAAGRVAAAPEAVVAMTPRLTSAPLVTSAGSTPRPARIGDPAASVMTVEALLAENFRLRQEVERQRVMIEELRSSLRTHCPGAEEPLAATTQLVAAPCSATTATAAGATLAKASAQPAPIRLVSGINTAGAACMVQTFSPRCGASSVPAPPPSRIFQAPPTVAGGYPVFVNQPAACVPPMTPRRIDAATPSSPRPSTEQTKSPVWAKIAAVYAAPPVAATAVQGRFTPVPVQAVQPQQQQPSSVVPAKMAQIGGSLQPTYCLLTPRQGTAQTGDSAAARSTSMAT